MKVSLRTLCFSNTIIDSRVTICQKVERKFNFARWTGKKWCNEQWRMNSENVPIDHQSTVWQFSIESQVNCRQLDFKRIKKKIESIFPLCRLLLSNYNGNFLRDYHWVSVVPFSFSFCLPTSQQPAFLLSLFVHSSALTVLNTMRLKWFRWRDTFKLHAAKSSTHQNSASRTKKQRRTNAANS